MRYLDSLRMPYCSADFAEIIVPWNSLIWAFVIVIFLIIFRGSISKLLDHVSRLKLKADKGGIEFSVAIGKAESQVAMAMESKSRSAATWAFSDKRDIARTVQEAVSGEQAARFAGAQVLWADDQPDNNIHERKAFEAIGLRVIMARTTQEALDLIKAHSFMAIISDMKRPPDSRAGYTLLDSLRRQGDNTPFIIYAGSCTAEHQKETTSHDGQGCTNRPDELFKLVTKAIINAA